MENHPLQASAHCAFLSPYMLPDPACTVRAWSVITRFDGPNVMNIIIEPPSKESQWPVLIYNRGGNQRFGSLTPEKVLRRLVPFAQAGFFVIASQYRGGDGSEGDDEFGGAELDDVLRVPELLRSHPQVDLDRIAMWGESRGGMMTYLALQRVDWIRAAITVGGMADLERTARLRPEMADVFHERFGGSAEAMKRRSAVHHVADFHQGTPILLLHGGADWRVSPLDSLDLSRLFLECQIPHRLIVFEGGDHMLREHRVDAERMMLDWLDRYARQRQPWPDLKPHGV